MGNVTGCSLLCCILFIMYYSGDFMNSHKLANFLLALLLIGLIVALGSPKKDPNSNIYLFDNGSHKDRNE